VIRILGGSLRLKKMSNSVGERSELPMKGGKDYSSWGPFSSLKSREESSGLWRTESQVIKIVDPSSAGRESKKKD